VIGDRSYPASAAGFRRISFESLEETRLSAADAAAYAARACHEVAVGIGHATLAVRFSRASAAAVFAERFADMRVDRAPDAVVFAVAFGAEAYFWRFPDRVRRWPDVPSDALLAFFADNVAWHEYLVGSSDVGIHAAVIARGPDLVALVGRSTAGKTTTAIAAVRNGFAFYSDERCIVQAGRVVPFLRAITIREGGRSVLLDGAETGCAIDARLRTFPVRGDVTLRPSALFNGRAGGPPRRLDGLFLIEGRDDSPSVHACSLYDVLPALLSSVICRETGLERMARFVAAFRETPTYRLQLGAPSATVDAIAKCLDESHAGAHR
jgi:hypothetical protein